MSNKRFQVYVLRCGRMYKIGQAIDPYARIRELTTGSAYPMRIWRTYACEDASRVERWLHRAAKPYQGRGGREWFELPDWFILWLQKQSAATLDRLAQENAAPPLPQPREEFIQCSHCGRSTRYRNAPYCYECKPLVERLDGLLARYDT